MKSLRKAFEFQKFADNRRLAAMISETEQRYSRTELNEDDLFFVNAAGVTNSDQDDPDSHLRK